jgi:DET1- and DDB1-associated protein 1
LALILKIIIFAVIVTEKKNILLRYLHQQWDKKNAPKKREHGNENANDGIMRKRPRLENRENNNS